MKLVQKQLEAPEDNIETVILENQDPKKKITILKSTIRALAQKQAEQAPATFLEHHPTTAAEASDIALKLEQTSSQAALGAGELITIVKKNGLFAPFANAEDWVAASFGAGKSTIANWVKLFKTVQDCGITKKEVSQVKYTPLVVIASILTPENKSTWLKLASELSVSKLKIKVAEFKAGGP